MNKILLVIALLFSSVSSQSKEDEPLKGKGILFFSTANMWDYGDVNVDGKPVGRIIGSTSLIKIEPGMHQLTGLYSAGGKSASLSIVFEIKPDSVTSLGTLVFIIQGTKSYFYKLKNDRAVHFYLQKNMPDVYSTISKEIFYPDDVYANGEIEELRKFIISNATVSNKNNDFIAGDLGVLVDIRGDVRKVDTGILEKITIIPAEDPNFENRYFLTSLGELYSDGANGFVVASQPKKFDVRSGFQAKNWIALENYAGDLSFSRGNGSVWEYIDTPISKEFTKTIIQPTNKFVVFGPITGGDNNEYDKLLGYLIDIESGVMKKIEWNKYVFKSSRFYFVSGRLIMDPVNLGGKAFLFYYDDKKDKWEEIKLPNRHCKIESDNVKLKLICSKGDNYYSNDAGVTWGAL